MQPKVSIVVPVYNKIEHIDAMLTSVHNQVWNNIQLILVNDGATDGTRNVIEEWLPRFQQRGYEIIVIDQENAGICAAVLAGMKRVDGEYFCSIDCDDLLHADFVSTMADFLASHTEYEWVCCDYMIRYGEIIRPHIAVSALPSDPSFLENFLLNRTFPVSWVYLFRMSYLQKCKVIENFVTSPRGCQEENLIIPVAAGKGRGHYIDRPLYLYVQDGRENRAEIHKHFESITPHFQKNQGIHAKIHIERLAVSSLEKQRLLAIQELQDKMIAAKYRWFMWNNLGVEKDCCVSAFEKLAASTNRIFTPADSVRVDILMHTGPFLLEAAIHNAIFGIYFPPPPANPGRVIGYGALGERAARYASLFEEKISPISTLWDKDAKEGSSLNGKPVTKPEFASVNKEDSILVFPKSEKVMDYVARAIENTGATMWPGDMGIDWLAREYFTLEWPYPQNPLIEAN